MLINQPGFLTKAHPADLSLQSSRFYPGLPQTFFSYAVLHDKIGVGENTEKGLGVTNNGVAKAPVSRMHGEHLKFFCTVK